MSYGPLGQHAHSHGDVLLDRLLYDHIKPRLPTSILDGHPVLGKS
jgi:hypothetical protein